MTLHLTSRDQSIIEAVQLLSQITTHQLQRLLFSELTSSPASRGVRTRRVLARLVAHGYLSRLELPGEWGGWVYQPAGSRTRTMVPHTLDVAELYVRLSEAEAAGKCKILEFTPESIHARIKADAYIWLEVDGQRVDYLAEIDRATEYRTQLRTKFRSYTRAYNAATDNFPQCLWIVSFAPRDRHDERVLLLQSLAKHEAEPALFEVCRLDQAIDRFLQP
jgi:hypothetical protein